MKLGKTVTGATLAFLSAVGCGSGNDDHSVGGVEVDQPNAAAASGDAVGNSGAQPAAPNVQAEASASPELARVEFSDGTVVRFEELDGGVVVQELRSELNPRRLVIKHDMSALEAFKALAPERPIPAALQQMHERMYAGAQTAAPAQSPADAPVETGNELPHDVDLEHNGEFQQSYPAANFLAAMCDFPLGNGAYKHTNRTDPHMDASMNVNSIYFAAGCDRGTITAQPCAGKNQGGFFSGKCGTTITLHAGYHQNGFYDAGPSYICDEGGGVTICVPNHKRFELRYGKITPTVNFHECAQPSSTLTG